MCTKYWLTACSSLPKKSVVRLTVCPALTIAVDLGREATNKHIMQCLAYVSFLKLLTYCVCSGTSFLFIVQENQAPVNPVL